MLPYVFHNNEKYFEGKKLLGTLLSVHKVAISSILEIIACIHSKMFSNFDICMQVTDQNLDVWQNSPGCVTDALRHYYYQYLSSTTEAAEVLSNSINYLTGRLR